MTDTELETRERILAAAHAVFVRHGTATARTQDIAAEAGVNKALLHYYFGTKDALAKAVFQRAAGELFPRLFGIFRSELPIEAKVREVIDFELDFLLARPYLPAYIVSELHAEPGRAAQLIGGPHGGVPLDVLERQIAERVAAGTMRPIAAEQFAVNLLALLVFPFVARPALAVVMGLDAERFAAFIAERKRTLADFFFAALRP